MLLWAIGFLGGYGAGLTNLFLGGAIVLFLINVFSSGGLSRRDEAR